MGQVTTGLIRVVTPPVTPNAWLLVSGDEVHSWDSAGNWEGQTITLASDPAGFPTYRQPAHLTDQLWVVFDNDDTPVVDCVDVLNGTVNSVANTGISSWDSPASTNLRFYLLVWDPATSKFYQGGWSKVGTTHTQWLRSFNADGSSPTGLYTRNTGTSPPKWGLVGSGAFASWTASGLDTREVSKAGSESTPSYDVVPNGVDWESTTHGDQWWGGTLGGSLPLHSDALKMRELVDKPSTSDVWPDDPELMDQNTVVAAPHDLRNPSPDSGRANLFFLSDSLDGDSRRPSYWWDRDDENSVRLGPTFDGIDAGTPPSSLLPYLAVAA